MNLYAKSFQWQIRKNQFWGLILAESTPRKMSDRIRIEFSKKCALFTLVYSAEEITKWLIRFSKLADEIQHMKKKETAVYKIKRFWEASAKEQDMKRPPEDQSALFDSNVWEKYIKEKKGK